MANSKQDRAMLLDPTRMKIAQQNAVLPGGPPNMQNNPMNVQSVGQQPASTDGISKHPYADTGNYYPQMGANVLNPENQMRSQLPQGNVVGQRLNSQPFNMQNQPAPNAEEPLEGVRLGEEAMRRELTSSQFMGPVGSAALMPGALDPTIPGSSASLNMMPKIQQVVGGEMIPGSTPQKIQKKGKK